MNYGLRRNPWTFRFRVSSVYDHEFPSAGREGAACHRLSIMSVLPGTSLRYCAKTCERGKMVLPDTAWTTAAAIFAPPLAEGSIGFA